MRYAVPWRGAVTRRRLDPFRTFMMADMIRLARDTYPKGQGFTPIRKGQWLAVYYHRTGSM
jgi:hypothetical protein